jgi:hypothetical protein
MTVKETLIALKEKFNALMAPAPPAVAPVAAAAPVVAPAPTEYTLQDGATKVTITDLNIGGVVMIAGAPAVAGSYTLQDGTAITVAEGGIISAVTPPAAAPVAAPVAAAAFAGGIEERLTALEELVNKLVQSSMSWELAEQARKDVVEMVSGSMDAIKAEMSAQKEVTGTMLQLVELLATEPNGDEDDATTKIKVFKPAAVSKEAFTAALFSKKVKTA